MESGRARIRSCGDLLAMEFVEEDNMVKQFSPCKGSSRNASPPQRGPRRLCGDGAPIAGSPSAIDLGPYTASQPSSATSSLAAALADLQVSSRHSSSSDLGDRSRVLAFAATQQAAAAGLAVAHSRSGSREDLASLAEEDGLCSPVLIGAVRSFDTIVLKTLTPIKTRSRATSQLEGGAGDAAPPPAPSSEPLVSPFSGSLKPKGPMGRPMVFHARTSSGMAAPGAYNPYDFTCAALSSEFRSPAKSLYSPYPTSSHTASASPTPSQWGSGSYRGASYRASAARMALAPSKDDEPDYYVSVPGVRRQQSGLSSAAASGQAAGQQGPAPAAGDAKPPTAGTGTVGVSATSSAALPRNPSGGSALLHATGSSGSASLLRHASSGSGTLGSGTTVHGFKGLFRNVIVRGAIH